MIKKAMAITTASVILACLGANSALAEKYKGNCLHQAGGGDDFDKCYVDVSNEGISLQFRDDAKESANQSINLDSIDSMTVQRVKKVTADRVLFSPVWKLKARFSLFKIRYIDPNTSETEGKTLSFRVKEKQGLPLLSELEKLTGKNVEIIEPEVDAPEAEGVSEKEQGDE